MTLFCFFLSLCYTIFIYEIMKNVFWFVDYFFSHFFHSSSRIYFSFWCFISHLNDMLPVRKSCITDLSAHTEKRHVYLFMLARCVFILNFFSLIFLPFKSTVLPKYKSIAENEKNRALDVLYYKNLLLLPVIVCLI